MTDPAPVIELGEILTLDPGEPTEYVLTAEASCGKNNGFWVCVKHPNVDTRNQLKRDSHVYAGGKPQRHRLGWLCMEHGLEVP